MSVDRHREMAAIKQESYRRKKDNATREKGLIIIHTGMGKGKTTASFGLAFRAMGQGLKVGMVQFIKGSIPTGEARLLQQFNLPIELHTLGDGFTWNTQDRAQDMATARAAWEQAVRMLRDIAFDMVILDELNLIIHYDYLPLDDVLMELRNKRERLHVVVTGRNADAALIELADLVTDMKIVKHPYTAGIKAQKGVEF
jgi:cob(I)alamin adenosyltransferase